jgi:hypothetical protein
MYTIGDTVNITYGGEPYTGIIINIVECEGKEERYIVEFKISRYMAYKERDLTPCP